MGHQRKSTMESCFKGFRYVNFKALKPTEYTTGYIMDALLEKIGTHVYKMGMHVGYLMSSDVLNTIVQKWRGNRDPDARRVEEIKEYFCNHPFVPVISVAFLDGRMLCYDGNHRREAFATLNVPTQVLLDVLSCPNGEKDIVREFLALNKTVPVSELHLACTQDSAIKDQILDLVRSYEKKFKSFSSTSHRCNAPNFNRDRFTDNLFQLYRASGRSIQDIANALERLNELYDPNTIVDHPLNAAYEGQALSERIREKCQKGGLWLFSRHREIPLQDIELAITRST